MLVSQHHLEEAITALRCLIIDNEFNSEVLVLSSNFHDIEKKSRTQTEYHENLTIRYSQISNSIISLASKIPDDLQIIKNRFKYELNGSAGIERIIDSLLHCSTSHFSHSVKVLKQQWSQRQQGELDSADSVSDFSDDFSNAIDEFSTQVLSHIELLDNNQLDYNSVLDYFWNNYLTDKDFTYINLKEKIKTITSSIYSSSIIDNIGEERSYMLLWEEEILAGKKEKSLEYINYVRIDLGVSKSMVYEFTSLSFLESLGASKIINDAIKGRIGSSFDKLKLYLLRAVVLEGKSTSLTHSLEYIYDRLMVAIEKIYINIDHNYILMEASSGQSRRRNIIKRCIEIAIEICELFKEYRLSNNRLLEKLVLELEGGGKYDWIQIFNHDELEDKTTFPSISSRKRLLSLIKKDGNNQSLSDNLYYALSNCQVPNDDSKVVRKLIIACEIAFLLYGDSRFKDLQPFSLKRITRARDVLLTTKNEPSNNDEDRVLESVLNQVKDEALKPISEEVVNESTVLNSNQINRKSRFLKFFSTYFKTILLTLLLTALLMILSLFWLI